MIFITYFYIIYYLIDVNRVHCYSGKDMDPNEPEPVQKVFMSAPSDNRVTEGPLTSLLRAYQGRRRFSPSYLFFFFFSVCVVGTVGAGALFDFLYYIRMTVLHTRFISNQCDGGRQATYNRNFCICNSW